MTDLEPVDWRGRLEHAVAETLRRRAGRAAIRRVLDEQRQHGLAARHRDKLARNRQEATVPDTPPCCAQVDEPPCPQHKQAARVVRRKGPASRTAGARAVVGDSGRAAPAPRDEP